MRRSKEGECEPIDMCVLTIVMIVFFEMCCLRMASALIFSDCTTISFALDRVGRRERERRKKSKRKTIKNKKIHKKEGRMMNERSYRKIRVPYL